MRKVSKLVSGVTAGTLLITGCESAPDGWTDSKAPNQLISCRTIVEANPIDFSTREKVILDLAHIVRKCYDETPPARVAAGPNTYKVGIQTRNGRVEFSTEEAEATQPIKVGAEVWHTTIGDQNEAEGKGPASLGFEQSAGQWNGHWTAAPGHLGSITFRDLTGPNAAVTSVSLDKEIQDEAVVTAAFEATAKDILAVLRSASNDGFLPGLTPPLLPFRP